MISGCYEELLADPTLLQSFPEDEWISIHEVSYLGTLFPCGVRGALHPADLPELWGQAGVDIINQLWQKSIEWGGFPHGNPGHWWGRWVEPANGNCLLPLWTGKVEPSATLSTLFHTGLTWAGHSGNEDLYQTCPISHGGLLASPFWM